MAEIVWTNEAVQCLESIHGYIETNNLTAAHKVVTEIYEKVQLLERHPRLGQRYERIVDQEVREILYGHYRIAYFVKDDENVEILGVFHSAMDIDRLIY